MQLFKKVNGWLDRLLYYPEIDNNILVRKKFFIISSAVVLLFVGCLTLTCIYLGLQILSLYGVFLLAIYTTLILVYGKVKKSLKWLGIVVQFLLILASFICILLLGGIPYSAGIVFVGLAAVIISVVFQNVRIALFFSFFYSLTIIVAALFQPYLSIPAEMSSEINIFFYTLNAVWISGYILAFVIYFIQQKIKTDQEEVQRLKELDEAKTQLFTNISHEFRTPLTIILGITEQRSKQLKKWKNEDFEVILRNGNHLLHLVNQMLDLSKLKAKAMPVNYIQGNIIQYFSIIIESFSSLAKQKAIELKLFIENKTIFMDYDPEKLLLIVSNLLSNAIKFTPESGSIKFHIKTIFLEGRKMLELKITDDGIGISEDDLSFIFDRFYQSSNKGAITNSGTGMGLALTKELILLLKGKITVSSELGKGSVFTVQLPISNEAIKDEKIEYSNIEGRISHFFLEPNRQSVKVVENKKIAKNSPIVLIVDDNPDVVNFLISLLKYDYQIETSSNGKEGFKKAIERIPDIVLSDVMMPIMDGLELLDSLKKNQKTSHIPVILLTAKSDVASKLEGLERGADAYLAKPFNKDELFVRMKKLIEFRRKFHNRYYGLNTSLESTDTSMQKEDNFMNKIRHLLEKHLHEDEYNISDICTELGMSRAQLYRKFKVLTNNTISKYFQRLRLQKAKTLLEQTDLNVTQVCFETGFKNCSHFSKAFTAEFKVNPKSLKQ